jgi:hypothetical protein
MKASSLYRLNGGRASSGCGCGGCGCGASGASAWRRATSAMCAASAGCQSWSKPASSTLPPSRAGPVTLTSWPKRASRGVRRAAEVHADPTGELCTPTASGDSQGDPNATDCPTSSDARCMSDCVSQATASAEVAVLRRTATQSTDEQERSVNWTWYEVVGVRSTPGVRPLAISAEWVGGGCLRAPEPLIFRNYCHKFGIVLRRYPWCPSTIVS